MLDSIAKRYGMRPSALIGEDNPWAAFSIDLHAHNWGVQEEKRQIWLQTIHGGRSGRR